MDIATCTEMGVLHYSQANWWLPLLIEIGDFLEEPLHLSLLSEKVVDVQLANNNKGTRIIHE